MTCKTCNQDKPLQEFPIRAKGKYRPRCKTCFYDRKKELRLDAELKTKEDMLMKVREVCMRVY